MRPESVSQCSLVRSQLLPLNPGRSLAMKHIDRAGVIRIIVAHIIPPDGEPIPLERTYMVMIPGLGVAGRYLLLFAPGCTVPPEQIDRPGKRGIPLFVIGRANCGTSTIQVDR